MGIKVFNSSIKRIVFLSFVLLCLQFSFVGFLNAQIKPQDNTQKALQHEVTVAIKLIQVFVSDKKGNPVTDLDQSEFEIYDDGELKPVYHFEKHILSLPAKTAEEVKAAAALEVPIKMNRKIFFLFDCGFNDQTGILKAKQAALHFVDNMLHPTDEVAVLSYSSRRSLTIHEYLTTDHKKIREVLEGFGVRQGIGRAEKLEDFIFSYPLDDDERAKLAPAKDSNGEEEFFNKLARESQRVSEDDSKKQSYRSQVANFTYVVKNLAKAFRFIPGNKNIIFFSQGIARAILYGKKYANIPDNPPQTAEQLAEYMNLFEGLTGDAGLRDSFEEMIKELKSSNCSVYAVNVAKTQAEIDFANLERATYENKDFLGDDSLRQLSNQTGGKYFNNTMDYKKAVEEIQTLTSAFYVLGYSIDEKWDGRYHKVKVKVKRKGCQVYSQGGYFNPKPFSEYTKFEKLLHIIDLALSENPQFQVPIDLSSASLLAPMGRESYAVMLSQLSKEKIQEIAGPQMEVVILVFDEQNTIKVLRSGRVNLSGIDKDKLYTSAILSLPAGKYNCRVILRNMESGKGARASSSVIIPAASDSPLQLSPPLLLTPERNVRYIEITTGVSLFNLYPFEEASYAPLLDELSPGLTKIFAVVRCSMTGVQYPEASLSAQLVDLQTGTKIPLPLSVLHRSQERNTQIFFIELSLGELKTGTYTLYIFAQEVNGPSSSYTMSHFHVK
jgi:VWFA-related protein